MTAANKPEGHRAIERAGARQCGNRTPARVREHRMRHAFFRRRASTDKAVLGLEKHMHASKYPPAEPGALGIEPLKAARQLPSVPYFRAILSRLPRTAISIPETPFCLCRFARYCGYCGGVLVFVPVHRGTPFRVRGGSRVESFIDGRLP